MSSPTALETIRTGTPDGTNGLLIANISSQEGATTEIPGGVMLSDRIANGPSAHRSGIAADDTATDMSSAGFSSSGLDNINNRGALVIWCEFASGTGTAVVRPVFFDAAATPAPLFLGPVLTFVASDKRVSNSGDYMSEAQIVETYGASKYKVYVESRTGTIDVFAHPI